MNSKYKDKLVGVYAPGNYGHTSVLDQTQAFSRWFWANRRYQYLRMASYTNVFNTRTRIRH